MYRGGLRWEMQQALASKFFFSCRAAKVFDPTRPISCLSHLSDLCTLFGSLPPPAGFPPTPDRPCLVCLACLLPSQVPQWLGGTTLRTAHCFAKGATEQPLRSSLGQWPAEICCGAAHRSRPSQRRPLPHHAHSRVHSTLSHQSIQIDLGGGFVQSSHTKGPNNALGMDKRPFPGSPEVATCSPQRLSVRWL
jgi:hypothetical protein